MVKYLNSKIGIHHRPTVWMLSSNWQTLHDDNVVYGGGGGGCIHLPSTSVVILQANMMIANAQVETRKR